MGALHAGHLELIRRAKRLPNIVVGVSIFVNPLQFGEGEDFRAYPRTLEADLAKLTEAGVDFAFIPTETDLYTANAAVTVHPGSLGQDLEGAHRPGHFEGVLTVVAKLLNIIRPDFAFFGEKDYQQLILLKQMAQDLNFDTHVIGVPTLRESDGLALSSRNIYLSESERADAAVLFQALTVGAHAGRYGAEAVLSAAQAVLAANSRILVDYIEVRGADLAEAPQDGEGRLLVAGRVGNTRLIDNVSVLLGGAADRGLGNEPDSGE
jgi:pantoate--beta-alanine ligase